VVALSTDVRLAVIRGPHMDRPLVGFPDDGSTSCDSSDVSCFVAGDCESVVSVPAVEATDLNLTLIGLVAEVVADFVSSRVETRGG
jgi:hypothetical protein